MRLSRTRSRDSSSGRLAGDQLVEGRLGVEHHRPQLALHLDALLARTAPGRPAAPRCRAPSGRASRRAASPGRSSARRPSAPAPPSRSRSPPRSSSCRPRPSRRRCRSPCPRGSRRRAGISRASSTSSPRRLDAELGLEEEGQGLDRRLDPAPQPGQLGALGAGAAVLGERRPRGRPRPRRPRRSASAAEPLGLRPCEKRSG